MSGKVMALFVKEKRGQPMRSVSEVLAVAGKGLQGDAAFGRDRRQVLLLGEATLNDFGLRPGDTRENITVAGMILDTLREGTFLRVGEVLLEVSGDCEPCAQMEALRPGLQQAIRGRRGMLARVNRGGTIRLGDTVCLEDGAASG